MLVIAKMLQIEPLIRIRNVHKAFGDNPVLCGVSLDIAPHETTVIIGPSGCGKSVLLRHIVGLLKPDIGEVYFRHYEVSSMSERKLAKVRSHIGFLFQGGALFDSMTVEQNVCFPLDEHGVGTRTERKDKCRSVLAIVGLDGFQNQYPENLSGGQKKRVALARAIAISPEVILYDEPTTGLDPIRADLINELIIKLQHTLGTTAIVVTHDMASARKVGDRIVMLHKGHLIIDTTPDALDDTDDETVMRFINGQASDAELAELRTEQFTTTGREQDE
jgi:phospholipid/cholesterol/gamma-HCH transport system ATP-binding protein